MRAPFVGILIALLTLLTLAGCSDRMKEAADREEKAEPKKINVNGKMEPAPPVGINETMVLVEGRWMRAKDEGVTWRVTCGDGECKPRLIKHKD